MSNRSIRTNGTSRPSDARREALSDNLSVPVVSNFFPLDSYYVVADKVYDSFQVALKQASKAKATGIDPAVDAALDDAYVYGKRYCKFCLEALPEHNYHGTSKYKALMNRHYAQVQKVITSIETVVVVQMDKYEQIKQEIYRQQQAQLAAQRRALEERRRLHAERKQQQRFEDLQRRIAKQKEQSSSSIGGDGTDGAATSTEASALSKLQLLLPTSSSTSSTSSLPRIQRDPSGEEPDEDELPLGQPSTRYAMTTSSDDDDDYGGALPPPLLPQANGGVGQPVPPPYNQVVSERSKRYQNNLLWDPNAAATTDNFINGARLQPIPPPPPYQHVTPNAPPPPYRPESTAAAERSKTKNNIPLSQLQKQYEQDYLRYQKQGRIRVTPIDTYQGRYSESTNGCTVISALVASAHLQSSKVGGVTDDKVVQVIDRQCGPVLRQIRSKLGLGGHALIIPSDVHDHLVDQKLLQQDKFVGAAGGNILDPEHLGAFLKILSVGENGQLGPCPTAATLFFREHVISIVKRVSSAGKVLSYDLIDSLPSLSYNGRSKASRTVCNDFDALQVLLRWYASRKFSPSHCAYVDRNQWNDSMADLDPRVFQGFVWGDAPSQ